MAAVNTIASQRFLPRPRPRPLSPCSRVLLSPASTPLTTTTRSSRITPPRPDQHRGARRDLAVASVAVQDLDVLPVKSSDPTDQPGGAVVGRERDDIMGDVGGSHVGGFAFESGGVGDVGGGARLSPSPSPPSMEEGDLGRVVDRTINATLVLAAGTFAITRLLTIDSDYWHGWTIYEILRYAPLHNWTAYEEALRTNPVLAKMMISGVVYSVGDWIAQCYEGKPLLDLDRTRMFRSGLVGFTLHGSLSHYYYQFCEALFPFNDWWVVPAKVAFDQTAWSALWNSIYYVVLGFLRFESPANIFKELRATFWPMLTAGWKLWPFAHLITYGAIPVEQRLLWVDCVELVWVTILSTYSNEKSEARNTGAMAESNTKSPSAVPEESMK